MICFLASHTQGSHGAFDYFAQYLRSQGHDVTGVSHPLDTYAHAATVLSHNEKVVTRIPRYNIGVLNYLLDTFLTVKFLYRRRCDVYIGANNFDTVSGIFGRFLFHRSNKVVYFASDFSPNRFDNRLLDAFYRLVERVAVHFSDIVISNTYRAEAKRRELGLDKKKSFVVPNNAPLAHKIFRPKKISKTSFIYVGNITAGSGLIDIVAILKPLITNLVIIGDSPEWSRVTASIKRIGVKTTLYRRMSHDYVISYLQKFNGFGLAPYDEKNQWTYYGSSLKIYDYIVCGVPVITSFRTEIAAYIKEKSLGIVYDSLSFDSMKRRIRSFRTDKYFMKSKSFYRRFNPEVLYGPILKKL